MLLQYHQYNTYSLSKCAGKQQIALDKVDTQDSDSASLQRARRPPRQPLSHMADNSAMRPTSIQKHAWRHQFT